MIFEKDLTECTYVVCIKALNTDFKLKQFETYTLNPDKFLYGNIDNNGEKIKHYLTGKYYHKLDRFVTLSEFNSKKEYYLTFKEVDVYQAGTKIVCIKPTQNLLLNEIYSIKESLDFCTDDSCGQYLLNEIPFRFFKSTRFISLEEVRILKLNEIFDE